MVEAKSKPQRKPINMVFLGETGAGKTTLLTALKDYVEGRSFEDR
jgi:DNA replication protein DnaC